jgi:hypothetical protein
MHTMSIAQLNVKVPAYTPVTPQSYGPILDVPATYWV